MSGYDIIIVGSGAAGLTAGIYSLRAGMNTLLLEKAACGGQILLSETIENFPGFPEGIKSLELAQRFKAQAQTAGVKIQTREVKQIIPKKSLPSPLHFIVQTEQQEYLTSAIILALGAAPKRLGVPGEEQLTGRGVSYCATCDGPLFRNQEVLVVGGGNAACEEALYLSKLTCRVTLVHRRDRLRADRVLQDRVKADPKIKILWQSRVKQIMGETKVSHVQIENVNTAQRQELRVSGVFIFAGFKPNTDFVRGLVKLDRQGFILTKANLETSRQGIFACGDCRLGALPQIVSACGEGAEAAVYCSKYVQQLKGTAYV